MPWKLVFQLFFGQLAIIRYIRVAKITIIFELKILLGHFF